MNKEYRTVKKRGLYTYNIKKELKKGNYCD